VKDCTATRSSRLMRIDASTLSMTPRWLIEYGIGTTCAARR